VSAPPLVTFAVTSSWDTGYNGEIRIQNRDTTPIPTWQLVFDNGPVISSLWNGTHTLDGVRHTVNNAGWNALIAPGATVTVGFGGVGTLAQNVANCSVAEAVEAVAVVAVAAEGRNLKRKPRGRIGRPKILMAIETSVPRILRSCWARGGQKASLAPRFLQM
jgi:hypothetical protein